ncbi:hypothetical protein [Pajaroellobacter abortibovis]|uniref:hypothetical protein n=1 Tax=Pajaroellobacter abortibovis TaxID=1882918 RepID=UPI0012EB5F5D|nr:hypothetical protein [Pajaroellobacter abortibovis]
MGWAWVDGLSSSAHRPDESFRILGHHSGLALFLALAAALIVLIISYGYKQNHQAIPRRGEDM